MPVPAVAGNVGFEKYGWATGWMFTVPMQNLNPTLGEQEFSGQGSKVENQVTASGKIHIVIKHTPQ